MNYSEQQLLQIEKLSALYMTITDIAMLINVNTETLREDIGCKQSEVHCAYLRGKATSKLTLRKQEMKLAMVGSPLALENCRISLLVMEDDE